MEERHFLPLAEGLLSEKALDPPQEEIFTRQDPLFEAQSEQRYAKLLEEILAWERDAQG
jgi:hemerythrin-like domain-containing protein